MHVCIKTLNNWTMYLTVFLFTAVRVEIYTMNYGRIHRHRQLLDNRDQTNRLIKYISII